MALGVNQSRWIAISLTCRGTNDLFWLLMSIIMILLVIWSSNNAHHAKLWSYGENHLIIFAGLPLPTAAQAGDSWHFAFLDALPSLRTISESLSVRKSLLFEISSIAYIISINSVNIVYVNTVYVNTVKRSLENFDTPGFSRSDFFRFQNILKSKNLSSLVGVRIIKMWPSIQAGAPQPPCVHRSIRK